MSITKYHKRQPLTEWTGDVPSLIAEMKRLATIETDQGLAQFLGLAQSTVSNWRQRDSVPEKAILRFEKAINNPPEFDAARIMYARAIALRLPEILQRSYNQKYDTDKLRSPHLISCMTVATGFNAVVHEVIRQMLRVEGQRNMTLSEAFDLLMEDDKFLEGLAAWLKEMPFDELVYRNQEVLNLAQENQ